MLEQLDKVLYNDKKHIIVAVNKLLNLVWLAPPDASDIADIFSVTKDLVYMASEVSCPECESENALQSSRSGFWYRKCKDCNHSWQNMYEIVTDSKKSRWW